MLTRVQFWWNGEIFLSVRNYAKGWAWMDLSGPLSRVQGSQAYIWMQTVLFLWQWLFCAAPGRHLCTKIVAAPRITIRSRTTRMRKDMPRDVAMVKKWRPRTSCTACSSKKTVGCQKLLQRSRKVCLWSSSWARITSPTCIGKTCELDNWDVHATVLHGDGVEFGAYGPPPRRNVCMWVNGGRPDELTWRKVHVHFSKWSNRSCRFP